MNCTHILYITFVHQEVIERATITSHSKECWVVSVGNQVCVIMSHIN